MYYGVDTGAGFYFWMPISNDKMPKGILVEGDLIGNERDVFHISATPVCPGHRTGHFRYDFIQWEFFSAPNEMLIIANVDTEWERSMYIKSDGEKLYYSTTRGEQGEGPIGEAYIPSAGWCNSAWDFSPTEFVIPNLYHYWDYAKHLSHGNEYALYVDALDSVSMSANNIANIASIVGLVRSIISGNALKCISKTAGVAEDVLMKMSKREIKSLCKGALTTAGDAWLKYRYAYTTTKSDVEEIKTKINSINNNIIVGRSSGQVSTPFGVGTTHCKVAVASKTGNSVLDFWRTLKQYGLSPDLYNLWDMIPFSFIADWFFQIGDKAEALSNEWKTSNLYFDLLGGCYSTKVQFQDTSLGEASTVTLYKRTAMRNFPNCDLDLEKSNPSTKTSFKRLIDGGSLLLSKQ